MAATWYCKRPEGPIQGPYSTEQLKGLVEDEWLMATDLVRLGESGKRRRAWQIEVLNLPPPLATPEATLDEGANVPAPASVNRKSPASSPKSKRRGSSSAQPPRPSGPGLASSD